VDGKGLRPKTERMKFAEKETRFLEANEVCRLATVYRDCRPHLVPVNYIFREGSFYIATDYGTRKLKNIQLNSKVALAVDTYRPNRAVVVEGGASVIERGPEFERIYQLFYEKFSWVRRDPWDEGEAPFLAIKPTRKVSWGL